MGRYGYEVADAQSDPQLEKAAKPSFQIHAVIVTHDPGLWFDEMLESLAAQDHPGVDVTVVDAGSESDPTVRIHSILPDAAVHRLGANPGFSTAANHVLDQGPVPDFFAICHDDVVLAPNALRLLAEEAIASNSGIVGPKHVDWDNPSAILQVALTVDKTGVVIPTVEAGELDQEQHDLIQDVFAVPGGCVLVRGDLFKAIGGFDREISFAYEHVNLCWRARTVGARVRVVPSAVVRHRQRLPERIARARAHRLLHRHRVRTLLCMYGVWHSVRVVPQALVISVVELLASLVSGRLGHARNIVAAWGHNLVRWRSIARRRREIGRTRRVSDTHVRVSQVRGFALFAGYLFGRESFGAPIGMEARASAQTTFLSRLSSARGPVAVWTLVAVLMLLGARSLITGGIPLVGEMSSLGSSSELSRGWWSEFRPLGLGQEGFAPTGLGILTVLSWLFGGATGLLRTVLIVGMLPLGGLGVWRLMRPFGSQWIQVVALGVYLANPVPYNALANGVWGGLLVYGAAPWLVRAVLAGARLAPFGDLDGIAGPGSRHPSVVRESLAIGLLVGLVGAMAPQAVVVPALIVGGVFLGSILAGTAEGMVRMVLVVVAGMVVAAVLNLPWLAESFTSLLGDRTGSGDGYSWAALLRFDTGPFSDDRLGWALPVAAVLPLVLAHDSRLAWAVRGWVLYLGSAAAALAAEHGWLPVPLPRPEVLLAPGAVGLAIAVAMGVAAFQVDVRRYRFGWRQVVPLTALVAIVAGMLPALAIVSDGDWNAPGDDYAEVVPFGVDSQDVDGLQVGEGHRVLWIGHPDVLPLGSWELAEGLSFGLSDADRFPTVAQRWTGSLDDQTRLVADAVIGAPGTGTKRLGAELSRWGIGTILVVERLAPAPYSDLVQPVPDWLTDTLDGQLDLDPGNVTSVIATYHNTVEPSPVSLGPVAAPDSGASGFTRFLLAVQVALWAVALAGLARLNRGQGRRRDDTGERVR